MIHNQTAAVQTLMKISLVIPTRERAFYLEHALNSARVAADRAGCATEIVVSDNASSDETPDILSGVDDARLVFLAATI